MVFGSSMVPSWFFHVTVYCLKVSLNCAVYVISPATVDTEGVQPLNVYVYCTVDSVVGVAPLYIGVVPYATLASVSSVVLPFFQVTVYCLKVSLNCAVYVTTPVTFDIAGDQPLNAYVYCSSAAFVGVEPP